jgi:hypothetical protein
MAMKPGFSELDACVRRRLSARRSRSVAPCSVGNGIGGSNLHSVTGAVAAAGAIRGFFSRPPTLKLASLPSIRSQSHRQASRATCSPLVHPGVLTLALRQTDRSNRCGPTSSTHPAAKSP